MKLALLKGNRFAPWHLKAYTLLPETEVVAFRADSEIQRVFDGQDDGSAPFAVEPIYFDTQAGPAIARAKNALLTRYFNREARIVPFAERLRGFDAIHTWELFSDWTAQALEARGRFGIPVAVMVWDNVPFNMETDAGRKRFKERAAAEADVFIVHTERSRRMLEMEKVPAEKIATIDPGVDTDAFSPGLRNRAALGVAEDEFVILFVGWMLPRKGIDFLVLALHELTRDSALARFKFRLAAVGTGPGRDRVERLLARTGLAARCTFLGSQIYDHMPALFRAADVFVLPSIATPEWQEQFGMSILEAMSCGTPVVTTLSGAIPEMTGDCAVLCQPNDFLSLYTAIKDLALNPAKRAALGEASRKHALARFTLEDFAKKLAAIYGPLAKARR